MGFLERLEAEYPALKRARVGILVAAVGFGLWVGLWIRAEQVATAKNEAASAQGLVKIKDAEIWMLREQLKSEDEAAAKGTAPADEGAGGGSEGAAPSAPKKWPSDPDTEIVETGKPKEEPPSFKTMPLPNN